MARTPKPPKAVGPAKTRRPASAKKANGPSPPSHDAIARRAHEIYQARGGGHGASLDDWLEAERQLKTPKKIRKG